MIETHPFKSFIPKNPKYLILGSFTGKITPENNYDWFYGTKRNQFWPILREVYKLKLADKNSKQKLLKKLKIAISDIIYQCERKKGTNLDNNLTNITYNTEAIRKIFKGNKIQKVFFSSRFVEKKYRQIFKDVVNKHPEVKLITLPSPSPRFAKMSLKEKIRSYARLLPNRKSLFI